MPFGRKAAKKKEPLGEAGLYDYAVKALGRQMRTEAELRRLMGTRAEPGEHGEAAVQAVLARLKQNHYLDDSPLPRPTRGCGSRTRSWASGECATICSRRAFAPR